MRIVELTNESRNNILNNLLKRSPNHYSKYEAVVNEIMGKVRQMGDRAFFEYTLSFDMRYNRLPL